MRVCLPICVTDSCAAPARDTATLLFTPSHSIKVTSLCSPKGAKHPPNRTDSTAAEAYPGCWFTLIEIQKI